MSGLNSDYLIQGKPEQSSTVGAIAFAEETVALPTKPSEALPEASWKFCGYVSEDGVKFSPSVDTEKIKDWGANIIRKLIKEFDGTIKYYILQLDKDAWAFALGDDHVELVPATATEGNIVKAKFGAHLAPNKHVVIKVKDDNRRIMIVVPKGQVTEFDDMEFKADSLVGLSCTLSCNDDGNGDAVYVYVDDGKKTSSVAMNKNGEVTKGSKKDLI